MTRFEVLRRLGNGALMSAVEVAAAEQVSHVDASVALLDALHLGEVARKKMRPSQGGRLRWVYTITAIGARRLAYYQQYGAGDGT